jgi:hypothetical protein
MSLVYDNIYELCRNKRDLIDWLQKEGLLGDFSGVCQVCLEGHVIDLELPIDPLPPLREF